MKLLPYRSMRLIKDNLIIISIVAVTVLGFFGIVFMASSQEKKSEASQTVDINELVTADTHVKGQASASATLVEFSDFQCPACGAFHPIVKQLELKYKNELKVAYRHFPLPQHTYAQKAAEAAEAAGEQGKFWEMHDAMFENQEHLTADDLKKYAKDLGLDTEKFNQALDSGKFANRVKEDITLGNKIGINATPTFYLNGKKLIIREGTDIEKSLLKELGR